MNIASKKNQNYIPRAFYFFKKKVVSMNIKWKKKHKNAFVISITLKVMKYKTSICDEFSFNPHLTIFFSLRAFQSEECNFFLFFLYLLFI